MTRYKVPLRKEHVTTGTIIVEAPSAIAAVRKVREMMDAASPLQTIDPRIEWTEPEYLDWSFQIWIADFDLDDMIGETFNGAILELEIADERPQSAMVETRPARLRSKPFIDDANAGHMVSTAWLMETACAAIKREALDQQHDMVEGLWNWIDHIPHDNDEYGTAPDLQRDCWRILMAQFPQCFRQPGEANSFNWSRLRK